MAVPFFVFRVKSRQVIIDLISRTWKLLPRRARTAITRSVQPKFTVSAAGIVFNDKGEILLLDHTLRPHSGWGMPGGFVNAYEQPEAAFRRELKEETGLDLRNVSLYRCRTIKKHIEIIFLATAVGEAKVKSREIHNLMWASLDEMPPEMSLDQQFLVKKVLEDKVG
jgi:ADP-ribose pyrophosphatase YjhB (NUDIX family)